MGFCTVRWLWWPRWPRWTRWPWRGLALGCVLASGGVCGSACSAVHDDRQVGGVAVSGAERGDVPGDVTGAWAAELTFFDWNALSPKKFDVNAQGLGAGTQSLYVRKGRLPGSGKEVFIKVFDFRLDASSSTKSPHNEVQVGRYLNELAKQLTETNARGLVDDLVTLYGDLDSELDAIESHVQAYRQSDTSDSYSIGVYEEPLASIANWRRLRAQDKVAIIGSLAGVVESHVREPVASELLGWTLAPEGDVALVFTFAAGVNVGWRRAEEVAWFDVARAMQMAAQLKWFEDRTGKALREADAVQVLSDGRTVRLIDFDHELVDVGAPVGARLVRHSLLADFVLRFLDMLAASTADLVQDGELVDGIALVGSTDSTDSTWRATTTTPSAGGEVRAQMYLDMRQGWKLGSGPANHVRTPASCW